MDAQTLATIMQHRLPMSRYQALVDDCNVALMQAGCTTVNRVAMFLGQIYAESGGLQWTEELASGAEYENRADLGNTRVGDGERFKGRSFIQITGRSHYADLSQWAHKHGYVPTGTYFLDHPAKLAADEYAFLGAVWYWTVARPQMNTLADNRDIYGATLAVNGGTNGLSDRTLAWQTALNLGNKILPEDTLDMHKVRQLVVDGLRAIMTGKNHGYFTHNRFPNIVDTARGGINGRLNFQMNAIADVRKRVAALEKKGK